MALLVGVLLHELGHAVVARRRGLAVDGITLWFMGGLTRIEGEPGSPGAELRISGVGPAGQRGAGRRCAGSSAGASGISGPAASLSTALGWLAVINVALAVFNLLPAAPLDGGRVLHAGVWALTRSRWTASRLASGAGVALAGALMIGGIYSFVRGDSINGFVLAVLAWFMFVSARAEAQQAVMRHVLDGVTVADIMHPVAAAPGWFTVDALLQRTGGAPGTVLMLEEWTGGFGGVVSVDALAAIDPATRSHIRGIDVAVPITATRGAAPGDGALDAVTTDEHRQVVLVIAGDRTVGAVLPSDVEDYVRRGHGPPGRSSNPWLPAPVH